jgi:hypothetical protein
MRARVLGALALIACALSTSVGVDGADASTAPRRPTVEQLNQRGFDELNQCLATRQRVDALYVLDVSGSLEFNDPDGIRFEALEASVAQLGTLAGSGADGMQVNVAVATFGNGFTPPPQVHDWSRLPGGGSLPAYAAGVRREAEAAWQTAGTNQGTNYEAALEGAARVMRSRGSTADACQMVLWFTDGLFALGDPYSQSVTDQASARMCARDGTLDQLRRDGVSVIALALTGDDIDAQLQEPEYRPRRGELAAMALSQRAQKRCGTSPVPKTWRPGIYLSAEDPAVLGALFSGVAAQASGCVPTSIQTTLPARFPVDAGVGRFQVDLSLSDSSTPLQLQAPNEPPATVSPGTSQYAGARVRLDRAGNLSSLRVVMGASAAQGEWSVSGPPAQPTSISLYRCSDLRLAIARPDRPLPGGEASSVSAVVTDSTGAPADLTSFRGLDAGARIGASSSDAEDVEAQVSDAASGQINVTVTPRDDRLSMHLTLSFVPKLQDAASTELSPVTASAVLPVSPSGSYPTISPVTELDLGTTKGLDPATGAWTVTGSDQGSSRVCFGTVGEVDAPLEAGGVDIDVSAECVKLAKGETKQVRISATPEVTADGAVSAQVPITLENADGDKIREDLDVRWELQRRVDQGRRLWMLLLALGVAVAVPLLVLALINLLLARFKGGDVRFGAFAVHIAEDGGVQPVDEIGVRGLMSRYVQGSERKKIANVGAGIDLVALASKNPLGSPRFIARATPGWRVVSGDATVEGRALECDVTPGLGAVWVLVLSDSDLIVEDVEQPTPATLLLVTREEGQDQIDRLVARTRAALSDGRWTRVRRDLRDLAQKATTHSTGFRAPASSGAPTGDESARGDLSTPEDNDPFGLGSSYSEAPAPQRAGRVKKSAPRAVPESDDTYEDPFA